MNTGTSGTINVSAFFAGIYGWFYDGIASLDLPGSLALVAVIMAIIGSYYTIKVNRAKLERMERDASEGKDYE